MNGRLLVCALAGGMLFAWAGGVQADPPTEFDYQGKILVDAVPLTGDGYFKYAISDEAGSTNFWAHDGTATGEPGTFLTNGCYNGVFSAIVGGAPMGAIDADIFALSTSLYLRVWFSVDGVTFNEMLPAQRLLSAPYAVNADLLDGYHAADLLGGGITETVPVFAASAAFGITTTQVGNWDTAYGWGDHAAAGYATGMPVYVETDPVWTSASNFYYQKTEADNQFVDVAGDTMTGDLTIDSGAGNDLVVDSSGNVVRIGNSAVASGGGGVAVGPLSDGSNSGAAVGMAADGGTTGAALGTSADGNFNGSAVGYQTDGSAGGAAVGYQANGSASGSAMGQSSVGFSYGAAMGYAAKAAWYGAAVGRSANGATNGVAVGYGANGAFTNVAIGVAANAQQGTERIAIGHNVTNDVDESARIRGALYMDGGQAVFGRRPFATGAFQQLLPLPPLENVVYVATNGTAAGPGTIDRPFDVPQNAYAYAAVKYVGFPATVVIASGQYPALNMNAGNVHVIGESRAELASLLITAAANSIRGKQRVENLIVAGAAIVAADLGEDVKFHNCRFDGGLMIYGPNVEVQDCFATVGDGGAVTVGDGINNIANVALTQSSFVNESLSQGTLTVNLGVFNFETIGCQFHNKLAGPCIQDLETGPMVPLHLYTHNYIVGDPAGISVRDPVVGAGAGPTIAFTQNTVLGGVGMNGNSQFYANNIVYGLINNVGGPGTPGWLQFGAGTGLDGAGNTEHEIIVPPLPVSWVD